MGKVISTERGTEQTLNKLFFFPISLLKEVLNSFQRNLTNFHMAYPTQTLTGRTDWILSKKKKNLVSNLGK